MIHRIILPILLGIIMALLILNWAPRWMYANDQPSITQPLITTTSSTTASSTTISATADTVSYANAVNAAAPAVVNIYTRKTVKRQQHPILDDPYFKQYLTLAPEPDERMKSSLGSGVIMSASGYVLTNHHVVHSADEIVIALRDGREASAMLIGSDAEVDLALLKTELTHLPVINSAPAHGQHIGDVVLAIGNPFGVGQTVTMGIISAIGRNQLGLNTYENYIQTDAAINPGNSGGALVNAYGELVGINTAIYSQSGGSEGIGFAIPAATATRVVNDIIQHGATVRGWLGIEVQEATPELLQQLALPQALSGLIVTGIYPAGPAEQAGLANGDILTMINKQDAANAQAAMNQIAALRPGDGIDLTFLRNGKIIHTRAIAGKRQSQ